jgi:hypothetical protein
VHVDRHPLALGEQVGNEDWRDGDFLFHGSYSSTKFLSKFFGGKFFCHGFPVIYFLS